MPPSSAPTGSAAAGPVRVYVPATLASARALVPSGSLGPPPVAACAVTPSLREDLPGADLEELEYAAMRRAADASLALLAADPAAPSRRVVLAVDVLPAWVRAGLDDGPAGVRIDSVIPSSRLVSVHVDDPAAEPDVRAAVLALPGGPGGLQDPVEDLLEDHELLWYAAMELPDLLGLRGSMRA